MTTRVQRAAAAVAAALLLLLPAVARGQSFESLGTRAAGMAGAFVAVTDDASAVYWNPAALASGALFSVVIDRTSGKGTLDEAADLRGGSRSGTLVGLSTPPLGLAYYRLRSSWVAPALTTPTGQSLVQTLITHHSGVTLVQSLADGVSVGATIKFVRGVATSQLVAGTDVDRLLGDAGDLVGKASNKVDADLGVSAVVGTLRAGLTVRNLANPGFESASGDTTLRLERQARAGVALTAATGWLVALDLDLNSVRGSVGRVRNLAVGSEAHLTSRGLVRAGVRVNTLGDEPGGRAPVVTVGGSLAAFSSFWLETQATIGSAAGDRGWGLGARVSF